MSCQMDSRATSDVAWWGFLEGFPEIADKPTFSFALDVLTAPKELDYFISYRRSDGGTVARMLHEMLVLRGLTGFLDKDSIGQGNYKASIRDGITQARNFILVISPSIFQSGEVVEEIRTAMDMGKDIYPIFPGGIDGFPPIPESLAGLEKENAFYLHHNDFQLEKFLQKLTSRQSVIIEACRKYWIAEPHTSCQKVLDAWTKLAGESSVIQIAAGRLRQQWQEDLKGRRTSRTILGTLPTSQLKQIAGSPQVSVQSWGNRQSVVEALSKWIDQDGAHPDSPFGATKRPVDAFRGDRYIRLKDCVFQTVDVHGYRKTAQQHLLELLEWEGDEVPALRELVDALFDSPNFRKVSDVLDSFPSGLLTAAGLKEIRDELEIEESGLNSMDRIKQYFDLWVDGREGQYSDGSE